VHVLLKNGRWSNIIGEASSKALAKLFAAAYNARRKEQLEERRWLKSYSRKQARR